MLRSDRACDACSRSENGSLRPAMSCVLSWPLPASTTGAGNGLYRYGASLAFPNASWRATNYWVDVVFGP